MCVTMQSSHRLRPATALVRALLAPTTSGDGAGERFCAPLPPSPPRFRGIVLKTGKQCHTETMKSKRSW